MPGDSFFAEKLDILKANGALRVLPIVQSPQGGHFTVDGQSYLNLCSNNYLGLAADPRVREAAKKAIDAYGVGTASVRALIGTNPLHQTLEANLARFKHADDAVALTSGYLANLAAIQTFVGRGDIVVSDELNHASIIDAIALAKVDKKVIYPHADGAALRAKIPEIRALQAEKKKDGSDPVTVIVTDGVFSMDGDIAPLPELLEVAKELDAFLIVDDAHGEGVLGDHGRGVVDHFGLHGNDNIIEVGTLSKAFGVVGGFVSGSKSMVEFLRQKARQFLFTNALSIPDTAALIEGVRILEESDERVQRLWANTRLLQEGLHAAGFNTGVTQTPITPVMTNDESKARALVAELKKEGILTTPIVFPMVAQGAARIRLQPSAAHTAEDMEIAVKKITEAGRKLGILKPGSF